MVDISAIPACIAICPFPLLSVSSVADRNQASVPLLLVGERKACCALLRNRVIVPRSFIPQYHRVLSDGACCRVNSADRCVVALGDCASTVTLHTVPLACEGPSSDGAVSTVFVGDAWDRVSCIHKIVPVGRGGGPVDAVCIREGDSGVVWGITFDRGDAHKINICPTPEAFILHRQQCCSTFVGESFLASSRDTLFTVSTGGELQLSIALSKGTGPLQAVQSCGEGRPLCAVVSACGTILLYDWRRSDEPLWFQRITGTHGNGHCVDSVATPAGVMASFPGGVWGAYVGDRFAFLRCTDGLVTCKLSTTPRYFLPPKFNPVDVVFEGGTLHVVGSM
uniref:Uncharacterized protein TCIL3000_10_8900 n=1 Tax=Trypanosoma congolense (strain IL3000) TaxID=1068625 RepID=G0UXJ6_TRYCI|nr:unnamed protein product [Trypanosoma congolense IL3000]